MATVSNLIPARIDPRHLALPYAISFTRAGLSGFPSPAQDYDGGSLDLHERFIRHPSATFYVTVDGDSMLEAGIHPGDTLIIDRSLETLPGRIVIAVVDGEMTVKRFEIRHGRPYLVSANPKYAPIPFNDDGYQIWGVVRCVIHETI
ncbi:LexA family protein [Phytohalomonas tamaricis]|uniref:LexA family protein n=1 Tax=Phytohalomonas tamaricis TaxID=2081032 RepID=UPI000D0B07E4|nr:translesion error-prone DNA polymerase V autoproteolytic subunit [Phytohalomonas tamaricis]